MLTLSMALVIPALTVQPTDNPAITSKAALQPLNVLVGTWKGTGTPEGVSRETRSAGLWTETITWGWKFKGDDCWLEVAFDRGKHYRKGELRYRSATSMYQLILETSSLEKQIFMGVLNDKILTLKRLEGPEEEEQQLVFSLLHPNRHLYRFETRPKGSTLNFDKKFQVGATKEGVPFADVPRGPECIVSGGAGTMRVTYNGKEYYVCCSGCRDEFKADPEKYIKEAKAKANK